MTTPLSPDQLLELGYELFLTHAAEQLPAEDIVDITLEFETRGAVESCSPSADWVNEIGLFSASEWVEIWVGLLDHQDEFSVIYAKIILPVTGELDRGHIRWKPAS